MAAAEPARWVRRRRRRRGGRGRASRAPPRSRRAACWGGMPFPDVLGHDRIKGLLGARARARAACRPRSCSAGPEGVGKRTLALAVARGLLCDEGPGERLRAVPRRARRTARGHPPRPRSWCEPDGARADQDRAGARRRARDRGPALRGARARGRHRRRAHHDRAGHERAAQEPRGAAGDLAPAPGHGLARRRCCPRSARAARPLRLGPLPSALLESHLQERLAPRRRRMRACAPRSPAAAWARPWPSRPTATARCATSSWSCWRRLTGAAARRSAGGGGAPGRRRGPRRSPWPPCARCCATWPRCARRGRARAPAQRRRGRRASRALAAGTARRRGRSALADTVEEIRDGLRGQRQQAALDGRPASTPWPADAACRPFLALDSRRVC